MRIALLAGCVPLVLFTFAAVGQAPAAKDSAAAPGAASAAAAAPGDTNVLAKKVSIKALLKEPEFTNSIGMVMVKLSPVLWAGKYEVTQEEYQKVMGSNPSQFRGDRNPVDSVSYNDALRFCSMLDEAEKKEEMLPEGFSYTLPTQDQWASLMGDAGVNDAVSSLHGSRSGTAPVGSLGANGKGLYDTRGNVWEWCLDPQDKPYRVLKGGGWDTAVDASMRPEFRWYSKGPDDAQNNFGFRCILTAKSELKEDEP